VHDNSPQRDHPPGHPITSNGSEAVELTFPDLPRLELNQLLAQLVERAQEVMATPGPAARVVARHADRHQRSVPAGGAAPHRRRGA
jgi:hypothetical protein